MLSGCGFVACTVIYFSSYAGLILTQHNFKWLILFGVGIFVLLVPMFLVEYSALKARVFFWKGYAREMPNWVVPVINFLGLFFIFHFLFFLIQSHAGSPEIQGRAYVLSNHGTLIKVLTRREYLRLKASELRFFASGWMFFYFVPMMYWWYPRNRQNSAHNAEA